MTHTATRTARTARFVPSTLAALLALAMGSWASQAAAQSLSELFQAAKAYDAAYLAAKSQAESTKHKAAQAYAQKRPIIGARGSITRQSYESSEKLTPAQAAQAAQLGRTDLDLTSTSLSLSLSLKQSLYDKSINATIGEADLAGESANVDLRAAENDLIARLAQAYFDVLAAKDVLSTAQANKKALSEQLASAKRNFEVGNATITDTREAQARFDLATAQELAATNEVQVKSLALDQLVGQPNVTPRSLKVPVMMPALEPANVEDWVGQISTAPAVRKAELAQRYAKLETVKAKAGHLPTADLVAAVSQSRKLSGDASTTNPPGVSTSIGVEVNVPIFAGYAVQNKVKETLALEEKSERDLDNAKRSLTLTTRQVFFGLKSGMAQVKALEAAEASAKLALEATQLGYRVGVRVNKDVLDAQTAVANTQKDLYKARYDVLVASIKLRQASGSLKAEDLEGLNAMLAPQ
jgi:outer membrane protein